ncbi:MAG: GlcNAc-transferase family protein [Pseudomonadota bacterium]|nr:GlcNAc-transferase family protein [Pseudomonadota bacterium]
MNQTIFISIASYLDPMLFFTLRDATAKAARPDLLRFGVVDQHRDNQRAAIMALPCGPQVRYLYVDAHDTLGVSWARNLAFSLFDGEHFLLQIDSHTCFEPGWDTGLRTEHAKLLARSAHPLLSTYPYRFDMVDGVACYEAPDGRTALVLRPHPETPLSSEGVVLRFAGKHMFTDEAAAGCHVAAGFIFCAGKFVEEVPYDPYLYFHGEEQSLAVRAYTRGWDIFHPTRVPLYHLYKSANTPHETHHWHGDIDAARAFSGTYLTERAKRRLERLLCGDGLPGAYGLGSVRTLDEFIAFSGIDYKRRIVHEPQAGLLF